MPLRLPYLSCFRPSIWLPLWLFLSLPGWTQELDFNRDIRPILSSACFRCHGFDAKKREADLRLDTREGAIASRGDSKPAIVAGDPDASLLIARILSTDPDQVMPPPSSKRQLADQEKEILRKWIAQGAPYKQHWSFEAIGNPAIPEIADGPAAWQKSPLDRFLFTEMKRHSLEPQPEADRKTLVRRVAFTLTGLPPTLSEITEFESDTSDNAYERMVDRYLKSPHYGEEMARHWLDLARYGDTHGLHLDNERQMWAYRDWVVSAFNSNMPYSQFTIEQIAGDQLPSPTQSQLIATGFNRCNVTTGEGGAIDEEFLFRYAVDRTSTTVQTWLGLTAGCAVCHDHKYDPLTTKEFYSLYAYFYNAADPAMDGNVESTSPFQKLPTPNQASELSRYKSIEQGAKTKLLELAEAKTKVNSIANVSVKLDEDNKTTDNKPVVDVWLDDDFPIGSTSLRNTSRNAARWSQPASMEVPMGLRALHQSFGDKFEQTVGPGLVPYSLPEDPMLELWVRLDPQEPPKAIFIEVKAGKTTKRFGWAESDTESKLVGVEGDRRLGELPPLGVWKKLRIDLAASKFVPGADLQEFKLGQYGGVCWWDGLTCTGSKRAKDDLRMDVKLWWASRKGKDTPFAEGKVAEALKGGEESDVGKANIEGVASFFEAMIAAHPDSEIEEARRRWQQSKIDVAILESQIPGSLIFRDRTETRKAFVMTRGQYDQKGEEVEPATPSFLPKLVSKNDKAEKTRTNRLDLANWIVSDELSLPARVAVNRFWQQVFGTGLVLTSDDFGTQGASPTHPELLDHLAFQFRKEGWNVKQLMKGFIMTAAFRQSSSVPSSVRQKDPENRYLARGPRIRLDAEQVRDNALAVSGLLDSTMGGPGAKTYQPPNIWEPVGYGDSNTRYYVQDHGSSLYRRSLYCFIKRTAPPPFMSNFDGPNREMLCARRDRSNTPMQALQLMNDVQHFEAARKLAERTIRETTSDPEQRIRFLFRVVLARSPDDAELKATQKALTQFQVRLAANPADAKKMIQVGESIPTPTIEPIELATYTLLCNLILNLDETVMRN